MIAAGANVKALASYMGHSSVTITLGRCGHLLPGNEDEAADRLDGLSDEGGESDLVTAFVDELYQRRPSLERPPAVALLSPQ